MEQIPEKQLECSECKKASVIVYTEIVGKAMYRFSMCADCPILQQRLGGAAKQGKETTLSELTCGGCGVSAQEVQMGATLGCELCYEVFRDIIVHELIVQDKIPKSMQDLHATASLHVGRFPGQQAAMNPALRLLSLHQVLHETLKREDYEQAAWLRDQIQALTEKSDTTDHNG